MSFVAQPISARRPVPYDLIFFGVLLILAGFTDLYIIFANPEYSLAFFGMKFTGLANWIHKLIAPPIHFVLGYGTILGRRWAYTFLMVYSFYGLANATVNLWVLPGPHTIRTRFIIGTVVLLGYIFYRRDAFKN
jgi:hypothetical protein